MARYYPRVGEDLETVSRKLIEAAGPGNHRQVIYMAGEGPNGAFEVPDSVIDAYNDSDAISAGEEKAAEAERLREDDAAVRWIPGPDEPTVEDLRPDGEKTNVVQGTAEPVEDLPAARVVRARPAAKKTTSSKASKADGE